jgi:hypothetical protein
MHIDGEFYVCIPQHDKEGNTCPLDCSFVESPEDLGEVQHRKFGNMEAVSKWFTIESSRPSIKNRTIWNGKRKNNRWEKELPERAQTTKIERRAHQGQKCKHCNIMIKWKATRNQPWNGPPGSHEDCAHCELSTHQNGVPPTSLLYEIQRQAE